MLLDKTAPKTTKSSNEKMCSIIEHETQNFTQFNIGRRINKLTKLGDRITPENITHPISHSLKGVTARICNRI